jgi:hypothetical protein
LNPGFPHPGADITEEIVVQAIAPGADANAEAHDRVAMRADQTFDCPDGATLTKGCNHGDLSFNR